MLDGKIALTIAASLVWLTVYTWKSQRARRPPGPRRLPIVGNAFQMPQNYEWLTLSRWEQEYGRYTQNSRKGTYSPHQGDLVYLEAFGQPLLLLNSFKVAKDLLEKAIYSDRPHLEMARLKAGTILIRVAYGHYVSSDDDPFLTLIRASMSVFTRSAAAGVWLVDSIPLLKYFPRWLPGTGFLAKAKAWKDIVNKAVWAPYTRSKHCMESGSVLLPNTCATALAAISERLSPDVEEQLAWAAGTMTAGGLETLIIGMLNFILAMTLNPAVQAKAQAEIDAVVGPDRLPLISDQPSLPYVRSVLAEIIRLNPPIPLGVVHALRQDHIYKGMHIPKGSIVLPNIWHMLHDPGVFTNPMAFDPDRYRNLDAEIEKVTSVVFGFGRRSCPGRSLAESTLFAVASTVLATCEIAPKVDERGNDILPNVTYSSGIFRFPSRFECNIKSRTEHAQELLLHSVHEVPS
ncbi:putative monooxygenase [Mycena sanguinolenta]|uniref:Putative monooxygenase n=1 Tax=Mycena sanguinolenta TaxID=230812 RepID=A0A8H6Z826_9AGAR|nr:putative monooxygenase [Mycena sanguinolenta]